jgi:alpha-beta hydrolase superfamily lysophospholipase
VNASPVAGSRVELGAVSTAPETGSAPAPQGELGEPAFFGPPGARLFGWFLAPPAAVARGRAVLLVNPFGYESMCLHRTYRALAARLAARGLPVLRFDHAGTGDSEGDDLQPGRVESWVAGIVRAAEALRGWSGAPELALFGVRLGATLAFTAAARLGDVAAVAGWAPYRTGKELVRELRAFRMLKDLPPPQTGGPGAEEAAGYLLTEETCRSLGAVDLGALSRRPAPRALLLSRDDLAEDPRLAEALARQGVDVTRAPGVGYAGMMQDAFDSVVPHATLDQVAGWLEAGAPAPRAPLPGLRAAALASGAGGEPLAEEAVRFGPGRRLFGVLTSPAAGRADPARPAVILLNTGSNHHVGPNRLYVKLARQLAAAGFSALRFDVAGIGDSPVRPGGRENHLYAPEAPEDARHAMDFLAAHAGATRFALTGICSGAYVAFHSAVADPRVVAQVIVNLQAFEWKDGDSLVIRRRLEGKSTRFYRQLLVAPGTWLRLARGRVNAGWVLRVLGHRAATKARQHARAFASLLRTGRYEHSTVASSFYALLERGVDTLLVYAAEDGGLDVVDQHLGKNARKLRGRRGFRMEIVPDTDHTFTPTWSQPLLLDLVVGHLAATFPADARR